jgi:putative transposase
MKGKPQKGSPCEAIPFEERYKAEGVRPSMGSVGQWVRLANGFGWPMGSVGDCYLGALCESFFPTLECELIEQETFADRSEARRSIFRFTEGFCNQVHRGLPQPRSTPLHHRRPLAGRLRGRVPFTRSR